MPEHSATAECSFDLIHWGIHSVSCIPVLILDGFCLKLRLPLKTAIDSSINVICVHMCSAYANITICSIGFSLLCDV